MPTLLLLRHAKSSWGEPGQRDHDRPLNERGRRAAPAMGAEISRRGWQPDHALVSTAVRAGETFALVAPHLGNVEARFERGLYLAEPAAILGYLRTVPAGTRTLLVVGHNPGMHDLAINLASAESSSEALARVAVKYPTAGLSRFTFDGAWSDLAAHGAVLTDFISPRDLE